MITLRNNLILWIVLLYSLFNWGFMQIRVPPVSGGGVPLGEIVLFLFLATVNYTAVLGRLRYAVAMLPLMIWWAFGLSRAMVDFAAHGTWALRDAVHVIESLFILVGFVVAGHEPSLERIFRWLPRFLIVAVIYGAMYPIRDVIGSFSPRINSGNGFSVPI